jgi:uncharacterized membrane protein
MALHLERSIHINARPERVWAVMADVEHWPDWAESFRSVERIGNEPFGMGSAARLQVRGAPKLVWRVTEYTEGHSFSWESDSMGVHSRGSHVVDPADGGSRVTLTVTNSGLAATLLTPFLAWVGRRNLRMEAAGLKRRCESAQP